MTQLFKKTSMETTEERWPQENLQPKGKNRVFKNKTRSMKNKTRSIEDQDSILLVQTSSNSTKRKKKNVREKNVKYSFKTRSFKVKD